MSCVTEYKPGQIVKHREAINETWVDAEILTVEHIGGSDDWSTKITVRVLDRLWLVTGGTIQVEDDDISTRLRAFTADEHAATRRDIATLSGIEFRWTAR